MFESSIGIGPTGGYEKHRVTSEAYYNLNMLFYWELISDLDQECLYKVYSKEICCCNRIFENYKKATKSC